MKYRCRRVTAFPSINVTKTDLSSFDCISFHPILLPFLLFAIYLHVFNYSFRLTDQSQINRPRTNTTAGIGLFSQVTREQEVMALGLARGGAGWILRNISS